MVEEEKGILDGNENAHKVLPMLFEPIVYQIFMEGKKKEEEIKKSTALITISMMAKEKENSRIQA